MNVSEPWCVGIGKGEAVPTAVRVVGVQLIVEGQIMRQGWTYPVAAAWRQTTDGWESFGLGLPEGGTGSSIAGVVHTPSGLAFLGGAQIGETSSVPVIWLEP